MFKIRTLNPNDFERLEALKNDYPEIAKILNNKVLCILQPCIPYNLRFTPSIHIAVHEKNMLGFITLQSVSKLNNSWEINNVFVQNDVRNEGLGEELLKYVLSVYGGHGIEFFLAEVDSQNFAALSLFHQCGFRRYAKVHFFKKEFEIKDATNLLMDKDFIVRSQLKKDLQEIQKLDLSCIPADLRPALGRSKNYFSEKKNAFVVIDKSRNIIIGWAHLEKIELNNYFIELLLSPGWTHLYEQLLNTIILDCIETELEKITITVKVIDYNTQLTETLFKQGYLSSDIKELLVKTIWQKVKEKNKKTAKVIIPTTQPMSP